MDREEALDFLTKLAEAIALTFGSSCETVVHEMDGQRLRNLVLFNSHITGRSAGTTVSIYGNDTLEEPVNGMNLELDYHNQLVHLHGRDIKSTTIHMRGIDYHFALGINFDITSLERMRHVLDDLTAMSGLLSDTLKGESHDLETLFDESLKALNLKADSLKKPDRLALVRFLRERGAFRLQRSVPYIAERLGVTKYTVYNYLKKLES